MFVLQAATDEMVHKIIFGALGTFGTAVCGVFWKLLIDHTRFRAMYEERHKALSNRVTRVEESMGEIPNAMDRMANSLREGMTRLSESVERNAETTRAELKEVSADIAFLRGRAAAANERDAR